MSQQVEQVSKWIYAGLWGVMTRWFRVPDRPPALPSAVGESVESFKPAIGFLNYLKLQFWVGLLAIDGAILLAWIAITIAKPVWGLILLAPALFLAIAPDIVVYLAIHLRYDTTWYVLSDRSLRIRRGIWIIHETTITFENIQNVTVRQGPLQRWFGIANVSIDTAGGGGQQPHGQSNPWQASHCGLIEGVADAHRIRGLIMSRLGQSRTAGLGDEDLNSRSSTWSSEQVATLREIRDLIAAST
ncbi:MAG: PH domain-containing protein [Planctomycetota bacterium]|nr:PH domain-containing protein [Planctomycetota bacterium]